MKYYILAFVLLLFSLVVVNGGAQASSAISPPFVTGSENVGVVANGMTNPRRQLDGDDDEDISWMKDYSIRYNNCFADSGLVSFLLCPKYDGCKHGSSSGNDGHHRHEQCDDGSAIEYLVAFEYFVDAFTEAQLDAREYACEMVRENCEYDDVSYCYSNAGYDYGYCDDYGDDNDNEDAFDVQEYLQCAQIDDDGYYFVGPYCSSDDAFSIYLGVFTDEYCTVPADNSIYYNTYGTYLPYSTTSIIDPNDVCARCKEYGAEQDQNGGDDADDDDEVLEQCEELYGYVRSKCEADLYAQDDYGEYYSVGDTSGCSMIESLVEAEASLETNSAVSGDGNSWRSGIASRLSDGKVALIALLAIISVCAILLMVFLRRKRRQQAAIDETALVEEIRSNYTGEESHQTMD